MKRLIIALCLATLVVPIFVASATPISATYYEVQEEVVSPFNIEPDKPVEK